MKFSIFSLFMSNALIAIYTIIFFALRNNISFVKKISIKTCVFLYLLCMFRLMFPFEFPFTKILEAQTILNPLFHPIVSSIGNSDYRYTQLIVWVHWIGVLIFFVYGIYKYIKVYSYVYKLPQFNYENISNAVHAFNYPKEIRYCVLPVNTISSPMQIGLINPVILLPNIQYSEQELYYILKHELTHFENQDNWIKLATNVLICMSWWNPFSYLLIKELKKMLEYKCDSSVTESLSNSQKADYLNVLLKIYTLSLKQPHNKESDFFYKYSNAFTYNSSTEEIQNRFKLVASAENKKTFIAFPVMLFTIILFVLSYMYVLQPAYYTYPVGYDSEEDAYYLEPTNTVLRYAGDGQYEIIFEGKFLLYCDDDYAQQLKSEGFQIIYE